MKYLSTLFLALFIGLGSLSAQLAESDGYRVEGYLQQLTDRYNLSPDQVTQVQSILENYAVQKGEMMTQNLPNVKEEMRTYKKNMNQEIVQLLNENQKKLFIRDRKKDIRRKMKEKRRKNNKESLNQSKTKKQ